MPTLPSWTHILSFIKALGWTKGVFSLFFFMSHAWIYFLYNGRLKDRQAEIERVTKENREYRERFLKVYDSQLGYKPSKKKDKEIQ